MVVYGSPQERSVPGGFVQRLVTGDGMRRTRFHTCQGNLIDAASFAYLPHCISSTILLRLFGRRQEIPWLGYRVVKRLRTLITRDFRILEFGSGMSSLFFAERCASLVSIEGDPLWYETMRALFAKRGLSNIDYRLRGVDEYAQLDDFPDGSFDLVLIDGARRHEAAASAIRKCRPGGWILLDNSDLHWPPHRKARAIVLAAAAPDSVEVYNDLYPFGVQACESILLRVSG